MVNDTRPPTGAAPAPVDPFLFHTRPWAGLQVAFTSVDAGNLAFHVSGTAPGAAPDPEVQRTRVGAARHGVEDALGIPRGRTEYLTQVHSARVVPATGRGWGVAHALEEADAMVSASGRDPLAIMVADCLPVVFASPAGPTAVAHAGRRGLLDGVLENTVERLWHEGAGHGPGDIHAWIGPGICGRCYEVPKEMKVDGAARIPATASTTSWGTPALDLPAGAHAVLDHLGVTVHRIETCTLEDRRLFSHRREPGLGRFTGLVWREGEQDEPPLRTSP